MIQRGLVFLLVFMCGATPSLDARILSWQVQIQIDEVLSARQTIRDQQFAYVVGVLLEKRCGLMPEEIRFNGGQEGYPVVARESGEGACSKTINYVQVWRSLSGNVVQQEDLDYVKLEYISKVLNETALDRQDSVIDELNRIAGIE